MNLKSAFTSVFGAQCDLAKTRNQR